MSAPQIVLSEEVGFQSTQASERPDVDRAVAEPSTTPLNLPRRGKDPPKSLPKPWKPITLKSPVILSLVSISLLTIGLLEFASRRSQKEGALVFTRPDSSDFPRGPAFVCLYLPTITIVIYNLVWSWIDLDAKRLEPFFQLSKDKGVRAKESILLHYPFDFLPAASFTAFKHKHWSVFCSSTAAMILFWIITPLQSAIFARDTITISRSVDTRMTARLMPVEEQVAGLTAKFTNDAYDLTFLNAKLPNFTTKEYALAPFRMVDYPTVVLKQHENWTATTTLYGSELSCAQETPTSPNHTSYRSQVSQDCWRDFRWYSYEGSSVSYFAAFDPWASGHNNRTGRECSGAISIFAKAQSGPETVTLPHPYPHVIPVSYPDIRNMTVLACSVAYYTQQVNATVAATDLSVLSTTPVGPREALSESEFNTTNFEAVLARERASRAPGVQFPDRHVSMTFPRLQKKQVSIQNNLTLVMGLALAPSNQQFDYFLNPDHLNTAVESAFKILFAMAVNNVMIPQDTPSGVAGTGQHSYEANVILVVRPIALIVQVLLGIISLLGLLLLVFTWRQKSCLYADPASISSIASLTAGDKATLEDFRGCDSASNKELKSRIGNRYFRLIMEMHTGTPTTALISGRSLGDQTSEASHSEHLDRTEIYTCPKPVRPVILSLPVGVSFMLVLLSSIAGLGCIKGLIGARNDLLMAYLDQGLAQPSNKTIVRQLILNYLPTAFASAMSPFWILLNRHLCILQPFEELRRGRAPFSVSLGAEYTSLPPQMVLWRALRGRHYLLAVVCTAGLFANVLTVALSGLFSEKLVSIRNPTTSTQPLLPFFENTRIGGNNYLSAQVPYQDHFYVTNGNLTHHTPLPPWLTSEYFFLPFDSINQSSQTGDTYKAVTRGFGVGVNCEHALPTNGLEFVITPNGFNLSMTHTTLDGRNVTCIPATGYYQSAWQKNVSLDSMEEGSGRAGLELVYDMDLLDFNRRNHTDMNTDQLQQDKDFCMSTYTIGWARATVNSTSNGTEGTVSVDPSSLELTVMSCRPKLQTALFEVTFDHEGHILAAEQQEDFDKDLSKYFRGKEVELYTNITFFTRSREDLIWQYASGARSWMMYLIQAQSGLSAITDPAHTVPTFSATASAVQALSQKIFTILLSLNTDCLARASTNTNNGSQQISSATFTSKTRVFVNPVLFPIAMTILCLYFAVALLLYSRRPKRFLPRSPTTIASIIGYCFASHTFSKVVERNECDTGEVRVSRHDTKFGYGKFIGTDGRCHIGIDRAPLVVPLEAAAFHVPSSPAGRLGFLKGFGRGPRNRGCVRSS